METQVEKTKKKLKQYQQQVYKARLSTIVTKRD